MPFLWMVSASLKDLQTVYDFPPSLIPREQVMVRRDGRALKVAIYRPADGSPPRQVVIHRPLRDGLLVEVVGAGAPAGAPGGAPIRGPGGGSGSGFGRGRKQDPSPTPDPKPDPIRFRFGSRTPNPEPLPTQWAPAPTTDHLQWVPAKQVEPLRRVHPRWSNYREAWTAKPFTRYLWNTLLVTGFSVLGQVLSASLVAFGFARLQFPGRRFLFFVVLATMMLPAYVTMIPVYLIFRTFGWIDTFLPLIVPAFLGGGAFYIFLFRQFFLTLPRELDEVARLDGCSSLRVYWNILLPLCKPVIATVAVFSFIAHWNDFMNPLIYLNSPEKLTLAIGLRAFQGTYTTHLHLLMAAATLVLLPVLVVFFVAQKQFVQSVALTGIKG